MANTKPFVATACFCENVLEDKDGVLSAIRIVDTYSIPRIPEGVELPDALKGLQGLIILNGLISMRAGDVIGPGTISLVMNRTTGERVELSPPGGWPVVMTGNEQGVNVRLQIPLAVRNFGLLWFDVLWNGEVVTRMPLKLQQGEKPDSTTRPTL